MPRPRKPIEMHLLEGTYRADRHGDIAGRIVPEGQPFKPADLPKAASEFWDEVAHELTKAGVATQIDTTSLAEMCRWYALYRKSRDEIEGMKIRGKGYNKILGQVVAAWKEFKDCLSRFGLTPADRARLKVPEGPHENEGVRARRRA